MIKVCENPFCHNEFEQNKWDNQKYCNYFCGASYRRFRKRMENLHPIAQVFARIRYERWLKTKEWD